MKILSQIFILFIFVSCAGEVKNTDPTEEIKSLVPATTFLSQSDSSSFYDQDHTSAPDTVAYVGPWTCKAIRYPKYDSSISISAPFNSVKALRLLFPGNFNIWDDDRGLDQYLVDWKSNASKIKFETNYFGEYIYFPFGKGNETRICDTLYYRLKSKEYILVSFTSREFEVDGLRMGRFDGAVLGIALFEKQNQKWFLKAFNPAIVYNGSYSKACSPELAKLSSDEMGYKCLAMNGGAGGPFSAPLELIIRDSNTFVKVLNLPYARYEFDAGCSWKETIVSLEKEHIININLKGSYFLEGFTLFDNIFIPDCVERMGKQRDSSAFIYTYCYRRDSVNNFKLVNEYYQFR